MKQNAIDSQSILVVDDDESIRTLYQIELEDEGYNVTVASGAREALDLLSNNAPDLVVLDIKMPDMDGIAALQKIVGLKPDLPVIINSAYPHFKENFLTWVAEDYVTKSANLDELKNKIRLALERSAHRPESTRKSAKHSVKRRKDGSKVEAQRPCYIAT